MIRDEAGLAVNPHLFRHLAAQLFLEKHPGHYEEVKRLLGHKSIDTTIQSYAGLETIGAARRYDTIILNLRDEPVDA
jgi:integrase